MTTIFIFIGPFLVTWLCILIIIGLSLWSRDLLFNCDWLIKGNRGYWPWEAILPDLNNLWPFQTFKLFFLVVFSGTKSLDNYKENLKFVKLKIWQRYDIQRPFWKVIDFSFLSPFVFPLISSPLQSPGIFRNSLLSFPNFPPRMRLACPRLTKLVKIYLLSFYSDFKSQKCT